MKNTLLLMLSLSVNLSAGNLLRNSSFELGDAHFSSSRCKSITDGEIIDPGPSAEIDSTTATHGKNSLKLDLKKAEERVCWRFATHEFKLQPGKKYTFSFDAKSITPDGQISFACVSSQYFWQWHSWKNFRFTKDWKRYSMTIQIPPKKEGQVKYNEKFWMVLKTARDCVVWFDALNLEEGEFTVWRPAAPCESAVSVPRFLVEKNTLTAAVTAISYYADRLWSIDVEVNLSSPLKKIANRQVDFNLKKNQAVTKEVVFKNIPYGGFTISTIPDLVERSFVRIHENNAVWGSGYQVGLISGMLESTQEFVSPESVQLYWSNVYGKPGDFGRMVRMAGATWNQSWRCYNGYIGVLQPEQGKFDWSRTDLQLKNARNNKIKPSFAMFTQSLLVKRSGQDMGMLVPPWLRQTDRYGHPEGKTYGNWQQFKIVVPPPQVIADHVKALLQRYPNQYANIQLFGEFNGYMTPAMISEYAAAILPLVKKYSPESQFIAYTPTGDFQGNVGLCYQQLMKIGAGKYTQAYSFHPYDSPMDDSPNPAQKSIRAIKKSFRDAGMNMPLWNTEVYYLHKTWDYNYEAAAITRRFAIDMGEGVRASSPLTDKPLFDNHKTPLCDFNNTLMEPNAKFAAYNAAGHFFNGAVPVATLENNSVLGYTFKNHGKYYTVLWSKNNKTYVTIPGNPKVYDFYGTPLNITLNRYLVSREPIFLEWDESDPVKQLDQGRYAGLHDFVPSDLKQIPSGIGIRLRNEAGMKLGGSVRLISPWLEGETYTDFVPFENEMAIVVPAKIKSDAPDVFPVKVVFSGREKIFTCERTLNHIPILTLGRMYQAQGYDFTLQYKNGLLTVDVNVPNCSRKSAPQVWEGDCVEIYLDTDPLAGNINDMSLYHPNVSQAIVSLVNDGDVPVTEIHVTRGIKAKVSPGVKAIITIPVKGEFVGFNIAVNNANKHFALRGKNNFKDRSQFSLIQLQGSENGSKKGY